MTKHVEVKRIPIAEPFDYPAAKAEHADAIARGDSVTVEGRDLVIKTRIFVRRRHAA